MWVYQCPNTPGIKIYTCIIICFLNKIVAFGEIETICPIVLSGLNGNVLSL